MPKRDLIRRIDENYGDRPLIIDNSGGGGGSGTDWSADIYWLISWVNTLKGRTVLAGVGLTSDEVTFEAGSPTIIMDPPDDSGHQTTSVAVSDGHSHWIISYEDVSVETGTPNQILAPDAAGIATVSEIVAHVNLESPLWVSDDTESPDTRTSPTGDHYHDPGSGYVLPYVDIGVTLGEYNAKYLEMYAARGVFGVLPPDNVQTGLGGSIRSSAQGVGYLTRDIDAFEDTEMYTDADIFEDGEYVVLKAAPDFGGTRTGQSEVIKIDGAGALQGAGDYLYTIIRAEYGMFGGEEFSGTGGGASFDQSNDFDTWYFGYQPSNNPFLPSPLEGGEASVFVDAWYAGDSVVSLGAAVGDGLLEWSNEQLINSADGPGIAGWRRTATTNWDDLAAFFLAGNLKGFGDYASDTLGAGLAVDLSIDPDISTFEGLVVDTTQARGTNIQSRWFLSTAEIAQMLSTGFKVGIDISADATTALQFDSTTGDMVYGELANDYARWDHSGNVLDILALLTGSRSTYLQFLDIASASVPTAVTDAANVFWDETVGHLRAKFDDDSYANLSVDEFGELTDVTLSGEAINHTIFHNGSVWVNGAGHKLNVGTETALTIVTGAIDISSVGNNGLIDLRGQGSVDDDLVTISGGVIGDVIYLIVADPTTYGEITVLNTGNINLPNSLYLNSTSESAFLMLTTAGWNPILHTPTTYMDFNLIGTDVHREGRVHWDAEDGTLSVGMPGGDVELQLGQEMLVRCRNETGVQIDNGAVVYASGASGNKPLLGLADATDPLKLAVLGMATEDIAHNDNGYVNTKGFVRGLNTLGMTIGLPVFLDAATPGGFTQTRPLAPNYLWVMGIVIAAHATEGVVYNASTPGHVMMSMSDVFTEVPTDGEYLAYNNATSRFELTTSSGGVASELDDLSDVDLTGLSDNDILRYDLGTLLWKPEALASSYALDDLTDVSDPSPAENYTMYHDGATWVTGQGHRVNMGTASAFVIASGVADISSAGTKGLIDLRGEGSVDDDLVTISNGTVGDMILLHVADAATYGDITIKNTGNIKLAHDITLDSSGEGLALILTTAGWLPVSDLQNALADLSDVDATAPTDGQVLTWDNANSWWEPADVITPVAATVTVPLSFDVYVDVKERLTEYNIHGNLPGALTTADTLDSVTPIALTTGVGKLLIVINTATDFDGEIIVTGTKVDRDTKDETGSFVEYITVDALTTDTSSTDSNGNTIHAFSGAYITSNWYKGSVTFTTTDLDISNIDIYQIAFEQFGDYPNITVNSFDVTAECTNTAAWADLYLYALEVTDGKCEITEIASVNLSSADSEADLYYRLREGLVAKSLDGSTDVIWVGGHLGPHAQTYWEDITVKIWYDIVLSIVGNSVEAATGTMLWQPDFPPASPTNYDDEFDNSLLDTALWSEFDVSTLLTVSEDAAGLKMLQTANAGDDVTGIYQAIPAGDFSIATKISASAEDENHYHIGLALWEDATTTIDGIYHFALHYEAIASTEITVIQWTDHDTFASTLYDGPEAGDHATMQYLRLRRNGTTYYFEVSADGVGWLEVWSGTLAWVPAHFGIALNQNGVSNLDLAARAHFFRYVGSDVGNGGLMEGQRIVMQAQAIEAPNETTVMDLLHSQKAAADTPDDEFDAATLDAKWTVVSGSLGTIDFLEAGDVAKYELDETHNKLMVQTGDLATNEVEMRQDWTLGDGESIVVAVSHGMELEGDTSSNNELNVGMSLNDADTGWDDGNYFRLNWDVDATKGIGPMSYDGTTVVQSAAAEGLYYNLAFFRILRDGSNYHAFYSLDGFSWMRLGTATGTVYTNLWLFSTCGSTALNPPIPTSIFHWVRQGANTHHPWSPLIRISAAEAENHALTDHTDVTITSPSANHEVYYIGTGWVNGRGHRPNVDLATVIPISSGALDISAYPTKGLIDVRGESSLDDDLVNITNGNVGDVVFLVTEVPGTYGDITIKNTGNINVVSDIVLDSTTEAMGLVLTGFGWMPLHQSSLDGLTDTAMGTLWANQGFYYDGTDWVNGRGHRPNLDLAIVNVISSGALDVSLFPTNGMFDVRGESASDDILTDINGGYVGDVIFLTVEVPGTYGDITITNTGNIDIPHDVILNDTEDGIGLVYTLTGWKPFTPMNHIHATGVSGGQTQIGGLDASDDMDIASTAHATKGYIKEATAETDSVIVGQDSERTVATKANSKWSLHQSSGDPASHVAFFHLEVVNNTHQILVPGDVDNASIFWQARITGAAGAGTSGAGTTHIYAEFASSDSDEVILTVGSDVLTLHLEDIIGGSPTGQLSIHRSAGSTFTFEIFGMLLWQEYTI